MENNKIFHKLHILVKVLLVAVAVYSLRSGDHTVTIARGVVLFLLLFNDKIRATWVAVTTKVSAMLIVYLLFQFLFHMSLEESLTTVARLLLYILMIIWIKETTTLDSYVGDMDNVSSFLDKGQLGYKIKKGIYYINYYIVSTLISIENFSKNYSELSKQPGTIIQKITKVFLSTMMSQNEVRYKTDSILNTIKYRKFNWMVNILAMFFALIFVLINNPEVQEYAKVLYKNLI